MATGKIAATCAISQCNKATKHGGICQMHQSRWKRLGRYDLPSFGEKFWNRVDRSGGRNACWPWLRYRAKSGHGRLYRYPKLELSHRIAWELTYGKIPDGLDVCHRCDNGWCCNPKHLFVGTHSDNMADKERKNRGNHVRGESVYNARLFEKNIATIRKLKHSGKTNEEIATIFNVTASTISKVCNGRTWRHVR